MLYDIKIANQAKSSNPISFFQMYKTKIGEEMVPQKTNTDASGKSRKYEHIVERQLPFSIHIRRSNYYSREAAGVRERRGQQIERYNYYQASGPGRNRSAGINRQVLLRYIRE